MEQDYSNKEIIHLFSDLKNDLVEIKMRVGITNGRVSKLEKWQSFIMGGLAVITVLILPVIFILVTNFLQK